MSNMNNMQEYEARPIFTLAALRAGTSALRAAISLAFSLSTYHRGIHYCVLSRTLVGVKYSYGQNPYIVIQ